MKATEEQIRERAYSLWCQRGCPGDDTGSIDWAEAERQVNEEAERRSLKSRLVEWGLTGTEHEKERTDE